MDLLLDLARSQKVDLAKISILSLVDQYLAVIEGARRVRLELAADWLVMAAWLTWLKSRLLVPAAANDDLESGEMAAEALAERLREMNVIRTLAAWLAARPVLGQDVFARGAPESHHEYDRSRIVIEAGPFVRAYLEAIRRGTKTAPYTPRPLTLWTVQDALRRLADLVGSLPDWTTLEQFLPDHMDSPTERRAALSSTLLASLEMARGGTVRLRQEEAFGPILVRRGHAGGRSGRMSDDPEQQPVAESAAVPAVPEEPAPAGPRALREPDEDSLRLAEALVFASAEPVTPRGLARVLPDDIDADAVLAALRARYAGRGVELVDAGRRGDVPFGAGPGAPVAEGDRVAPPAASGGDGDTGDRRLPPADDAAGDRAYPRHGAVAADSGLVAGTEPDRTEGAARNPRAADPVGHHAGVPGAFRLEGSARTAPAGGSAAGDRAASRRPRRRCRRICSRRPRRMRATDSADDVGTR